MDDRVKEILENLISSAQRQLELLRLGVPFGGITDPIPDDEAGLLALIAKWQSELSRHQARHAEKP